MAKDNENADPGDVDPDNTANENSEADGQPGGSPDSGDSQDAKYEAAVKMANAEKEKRQTAETESASVKAQMAALQANVQPQAAAGQAKSNFVRIAEGLGIDPEFPSPEENGRIMEAMVQLSSAVQSQQSFITSHPDYSTAVGIHTQQGLQMAEPLKRVIAQNPGLASQVNLLGPEVLHQMATSDPQYIKELAEKAKGPDITVAEKAEEVIKAAAKKASISSAEGGGNLDKAAEIANMSNEKFDEHIEKIIEEG